MPYLPDGGHVLVRNAHDAHGLDGGGKFFILVETGHVDIAVAKEGVILVVFKNVLLWKYKFKG